MGHTVHSIFHVIRALHVSLMKKLGGIINAIFRLGVFGVCSGWSWNSLIHLWNSNTTLSSRTQSEKSKLRFLPCSAHTRWNLLCNYGGTSPSSLQEEKTRVI